MQTVTFIDGDVLLGRKGARHRSARGGVGSEWPRRREREEAACKKAKARQGQRQRQHLACRTLL